MAKKKPNPRKARSERNIGSILFREPGMVRQVSDVSLAATRSNPDVTAPVKIVIRNEELRRASSGNSQISQYRSAPKKRKK